MVDVFITPENKILNISFNQDQDCFIVATETGFRIYNTYPFQEIFQRSFDAGIGIATMYFKSNFLAFVGGGYHPKYPDTKVMLWDECSTRYIGEFAFKSCVKAVRLHNERIAIVLERKIYIYQLPNLKLLDVVETYCNPQGACALISTNPTVLICPDKKKGYLRAINYDNGSSVERKAHNSSIILLILNQDGKICATASDKGTLIRIYAVEGLKLLQELRRGTDKAEIKSIAFDKTTQWLACTSDKGTVHIFSLGGSYKEIYEGKDSPEEKKANPKSVVFNLVKGIIPYFTPQRSFAQLRISAFQAVVAFGPESSNSIIVITQDGKYYAAEFNPKLGGECKKYIKKQFFIP